MLVMIPYVYADHTDKRQCHRCDIDGVQKFVSIVLAVFSTHILLRIHRHTYKCYKYSWRLCFLHKPDLVSHRQQK